tara:strand:- start:8456 stop:9325 length:870 start_codon:yes stop_codon:yes gene_type:complete
MAVKPITNKQVVNNSNINRGKQVSTKNLKNNVGNRQATYVPGKNLSKNYAVTLKDVDTSILTHVKDVMRPSVKEANENIKVSVMYGNEERWSNVRKRGVMRDINGSLILPLIMLRRTSIERNTEILQNFEHDVKREHAQVVRGNTWSKDNRYDRFNIQFGNKPVYENIVTTMPNFVNVNYEFILWTGYIEQMNPLVESFIEQNYTYWGNSTEYKFLSTTDSIADASEMTIDGERLIRSTFNLIVKAYLLPEETNSVVTNRISQTQKKITPSRIVFGYEGDATDYEVGKK